MKKTIQRIGVISAALLALTITVNAQWTRNAVNGVTYLTNSGDKVGIGTNAPSYSLDIKQDANCSFRIQSKVNGSSNLILSRSTAAGNNCLVNYKTGNTDLWRTGVSGSNDDFKISNATGVDVLFANQAGNVGIGTISPLYKLDVAGDINVNSNKVILGGIYNYVKYDVGFGGPRVMGYNGGVLGGTAPDVDILRWNWNGATASVDIAGNVSIGTSGTSERLEVAGGRAKFTFDSQTTVTNVTIDGLTTTTHLPGLAFIASTDGDGVGGAGIFGVTYATGINIGDENGVAFAPVNASAFNVASDRRMKKEITDINASSYNKYLDYIRNIESATFLYNTETPETRAVPHIGVIAQSLPLELQAHITESAGKKSEARLGVSLADMQGLLVVAVKAIDSKQTDFEKENAELKKQIADMNDCIQSLCNAAANTSKAIGSDNAPAQLFQNSPNPFNQTTVIRYSLNSEFNTGRIIIRDLNGNLVKQISIANSGKGQVTINANELSQGTYTYTLEIAGASIDTKLMVVTK